MEKKDLKGKLVENKIIYIENDLTRGQQEQKNKNGYRKWEKKRRMACFG